MGMAGSWLRYCAFAAVLVACVSSAVADTPENEFKDLIRVNQKVSPLGPNAFGEQVNLYDGTLSFRQVDISLRGTGPDIEVARTRGDYDTALTSYTDFAFADWRLDVPEITSLSADINGSQPGTTPHWFFLQDNSRCSNFQTPPTISLLISQNYPPAAPEVFGPSNWWHGYNLHIPGGGNQDLLERDAANNSLAPQMGLSFPIVTKSNWQVSCLSQTSNGQPGEGFLVVSPDGTKYWMDWLVARKASMAGVSATGYPVFNRQMIEMLTSKIQDRFGNTVTYAYNSNGFPTSISASDGRQVTLAYNPQGFISTATVQGGSSGTRIWTYSYDNEASLYAYSLQNVTLPDGSAWAFSPLQYYGNSVGPFDEDTNFVSVINFNGPSGATPCQVYAGVGGAPQETETMTHPSGLTGTFVVQEMARGRSDVPYVCDTSYTGNGAPHLEIPPAYGVDSIVSKQYSGAGIATQSWGYSYSPFSYSFTTSCGSGCSTTTWTDVIDPNGNRTRHIFSNKYDNTEGQLLESDAFSGATSTTPIRTELNGYASSTAGPWPTHFGTSQQVYVNAGAIEQLSPTNLKTIAEEGDTYTDQVVAFDAYANPADVKRYSSIAGQTGVEETTSYLNDPTLWVIGRPLQVNNVTTGEVESANIYFSSSDLLASRASFGQLMMSYTYDGAGQLASFTDGNNHTTNIGNYHLGIPQSISYPDNTSESLVVDGFGQISSVTDQAGYTTQYTYNPVGRVAQIVYPYNSNTDNVHWNAETFSYTFVTGAERGIAGGHWDRVVTVGTNTDTTYFDATLNPVLEDDAITGTANSDISTAKSFDWKGKMTFESYPESGAQALSSITTGAHTTYDALERVSQSQQDSELGTLTTSTQYISGAGTQVTDPKGNVTTRHYQVFDTPSYDAITKVVAPTGITQAITRDVYGNPTTIVQSGAYGTENDSVTKTLMYDSYHRLCRSTEPETGSTVFSYDAANNLQWSAEGQTIMDGSCGVTDVASSARIMRTYDAMNRLLTIVPPAGTQSTTYTYEPRGLVATVRSGTSFWWASYNTRGQIYSEALWLDGQNAWGYGYLYDPNDHLGALIYPNLEGVSFSPDARGWPTQVGGYASEITYFPDGAVQSYTLGNGITQLTERNARQLPSSRSFGLGATLLFSEDYTYDGDANLTKIQDLFNGANNQTLGYDALSRLTSASAPNAWGTRTYGYDALNNLRQIVSGGYPFNLNIDATNRLISMTIGTTPFTAYQNNAAGDRVATTYQGSTTTYTFDALHQLLSIPGVESYAYDYAGRRVAKTPSGSSALYSFYNHAGQLVYSYDAGTSQGTNYIYLDGQLIARNQAGTPTYLLTDRQGSVVRETSASGTVTATLAYEPYGSLYSSPNENQPGYTGHEHDAETEFVYMQARYF